MPKRKRNSTAAYAASQPLFDALREACEQLELQKSNLLLARDLVQGLHVKLQHVDLAVGDRPSRVDNHGRYLDSTLAAWTTAINSYHNIFEQLVLLTAPEPAMGRDAADSHESFKNISRSAFEAKNAVAGVVSARDTSKRQTSDHKASNIGNWGIPTNEHSRFSQSPSGTDTKPRSSKLRKRNGLTASASNNHQHAEIATTPSANKPTAAKSGHNNKDLNNGAELLPKETNVFVKDGVKYEDVSAEVTARLQAKQEKKAAAKVKQDKKKRKRESTDSIRATNVKTSHVATSPVTDLPERPRRKRSKRTSSVASDQKSEQLGSGRSQRR
ncbi:uncharacterized protein K489DRAFT_366178 [Dissoconium aciculare CBS 342.82]|uniref:Uncharacterized protein n=1 Tax=Dissoconium aciculare CBS 342.82 TaxID=1314786 RepID=A0A6J3MGZ1_9PEZI|nr:uncharacterized protein K489DRAFT_366178 [Dissoconium aciculare CBS 342.82]KAF1826959.1 hypothetical protein K489DRAFT_366178 [Dissoconium aciculare CBS 342.82]